jgi:hypothetical protein
MPRLPAPEDYGVRTPSPTRGFVDLPKAEPDLYTGRVLGDIGLMMQQEAERVDDALAADALNKLQDKQLDLTYGDEGFTKLQGTQVTDRPVLKEYSDRMRIETEGLAAKISNPRIKQKFQLAAADVNRGFKQKLVMHTTSQVEKIEEQAFFGAAATAQRMAGEGDLTGAVSYMAPMIEAAVAKKGLTGDAAAAFARETMGAVYAANISKLVTDGRSAEAQTVLEANKGLMTEKQVEHFGNLVKSKRDWEVGNDLAVQAEAMQASGKSSKEIELWLAKETKGNKEAYAAAQSVWGQLQQATKEAAQEQQGTFNKQFWLKPTRATMNTILQSTEFLSLPKSVQGTITEHMVKGLEHEDAVARARRSETYNTPQAFSTFLNVMSSPDLARMSEDALWGLTPVIGPQNVTRLLAEQKQQQSGTARFQIDPKIVQAAMPEEITTGKGNKEKREAFNGIIAMELRDWKTQNPGKIPSEEEQSKILRSATKEYTINRKFWFDTTVKAYELKDMPAEFEAQAKAALRAKGLPVTTAAIRDAWARQPQARK